jgi:hypothetical protein
MTITAVPGPTGRVGRLGPGPRRSDRSWPSGAAAEAFLKGAAAAGVSRLGVELCELAGLDAAHGTDVLVAALERAVAFGRWRAADVRSILAAGTGTPQPTAPGEALLIPLPIVPTRPLSAYALEELQ